MSLSRSAPLTPEGSRSFFKPRTAQSLPASPGFLSCILAHSRKVPRDVKLCWLRESYFSQGGQRQFNLTLSRQHLHFLLSWRTARGSMNLKCSQRVADITGQSTSLVSAEFEGPTPQEASSLTSPLEEMLRLVSHHQEEFCAPCWFLEHRKDTLNVRM